MDMPILNVLILKVKYLIKYFSTDSARTPRYPSKFPQSSAVQFVSTHAQIASYNLTEATIRCFARLIIIVYRMKRDNLS